MKEHSETLDLILCHKWYDMIEAGIKREEYRRKSDYWNKRFKKYSYKYVRFHRGYTNRTMLFELKRIKMGFGNKEWGAPDEEVYIIYLGELVGVGT